VCAELEVLKRAVYKLVCVCVCVCVCLLSFRPLKGPFINSCVCAETEVLKRAVHKIVCVLSWKSLKEPFIK